MSLISIILMYQIADAINFYQTNFKDSIIHQLLKVNEDYGDKWKLFCLNSSDSIPKNFIEA